jgi:hypothetical protein
MAKKTVVDTETYQPTRKAMVAIDDNFDELYAQVVGLTEYADNAAAVTGGLAVGDFYQTTGAVKIVTA